MTVLPEPPRPFGSYPVDDVVFLLTDLTSRMGESTLAERDAHLRRGGHYAELLPIEYEPTAEYRSLYEAALERNAVAVARAVAIAAERILALGDERFVLVSLARAGTPIGVLLRRYLRTERGLDIPHYSISIVRDRGLDRVAIAWLRHHHPDAAIRFVDGWTGKGAIQRELTKECADLGLDDRMAVAVDPGWCAALPGRRADLLVPSACLNATVSGLVSRTVFRDDLIGPGDFHGSKEYAELAPVDVSNSFVDTVSAAFSPRMAEAAAACAAVPAEEPTWAGWRAVDAIGATFGIDDPNRIKPGIGEATRVLLRRTPWRLLVRGDSPDLEHLHQLANERSVPVEVFEGMPFAACGLVKG